MSFNTDSLDYDLTIKDDTQLENYKKLHNSDPFERPDHPAPLELRVEKLEAENEQLVADIKWLKEEIRRMWFVIENS